MTIEIKNKARIAIYDDMLSSPKIIDIEPCAINEFIEKIADNTYENAKSQGGKIAYSIIRQVAENFIHADFKEPTVSILNNGNTIRFSDQGPGIQDKTRAQLPGFSSATSEMKEYINGVGSGFPIVKEYLSYSNGQLLIEDNLNVGSVITISINNSEGFNAVEVFKETSVNQNQNNNKEMPFEQLRRELSDRQIDLLYIISEEGKLGPKEISTVLGVSIPTAYRDLKELQDFNLLENSPETTKRVISDKGKKFIEFLGRYDG